MLKTEESPRVCIIIKDGKIHVTHEHKKYPLSKESMVLNENENAFLVGPYPDKNTIILRFDHYHQMMNELRNNCPNAKNWRITATVFICMFVLLSILFLLQSSYCHDLLDYIKTKYNRNQKEIN